MDGSTYPAKNRFRAPGNVASWWVVRHCKASVERRKANPEGAGFNPSRAFDVVFTCSLRACVGFLHSHIGSCDGGGDLQCYDHLYKTFTIPERISLIETELKGLNDVTTGQINGSSTHHKRILLLKPPFKSCAAI